MNDETEIDELAPWLVVVITVIGGWMRVLLLGNTGLRLEEIYSVWLSNHSIADMLHWVVTIDNHPPLYYLLLRYWMAFIGETPRYARLLSALLGAGAIPFIYLIGKRISGKVMGLAAAIFLAISPFNIRFAQETRMYTLLMFNVTVAIYALVVLLTDSRSTRPIGSQFREYLHTWRTYSPVEPNTDAEFSYKDKTINQTGWRAWIFRHRWSPIQSIETDLAWLAFIIFSVASLFSDNTAVLFLITTNVFVLGLLLYQRINKPGPQSTFQAPSFWSWVIVQVVILILCSPWITTFIQQIGRVYQEFLIPKPSWNIVIQVLKSFLNEFMATTANFELIFWILYAVVLCFGLVHFLKKMPRFLFLAVLLVIPFLGELIISIRQPIFSDRTLIWTTIPLFLVLAAGITQLRFRLLIIIVLGVLGVNNLFSVSDYFRFPPREDWNIVAGSVANFVQKDDLILFNATWVQIPFDYYFIPYEKQYLYQVVKHGVPVDLFESGIPEPRMTDSDVPRLISLLSGHKRVWLIYSLNGYTDPMGLIPQTLASEMKMVAEHDFNQVRLQFYMTP